jgi:hypothetical protein
MSGSGSGGNLSCRAERNNATSDGVLTVSDAVESIRFGDVRCWQFNSFRLTAFGYACIFWRLRDAINPSAWTHRARSAGFTPHLNLVPEQFFKRNSCAGRPLRQENG